MSEHAISNKENDEIEFIKTVKMWIPIHNSELKFMSNDLLLSAHWDSCNSTLTSKLRYTPSWIYVVNYNCSWL